MRHTHPFPSQMTIAKMIRHLVDDHGVAETRKLWRSNRASIEERHAALHPAVATSWPPFPSRDFRVVGGRIGFLADLIEWPPVGSEMPSDLRDLRDFL